MLKSLSYKFVVEVKQLHTPKNRAILELKFVVSLRLQHTLLCSLAQFFFKKEQFLHGHMSNMRENAEQS
jgi:hypothetical protein